MEIVGPGARDSLKFLVVNHQIGAGPADNPQESDGSRLVDGGTNPWTRDAILKSFGPGKWSGSETAPRRHLRRARVPHLSPHARTPAPGRVREPNDGFLQLPVRHGPAVVGGSFPRPERNLAPDRELLVVVIAV